MSRWSAAGREPADCGSHGDSRGLIDIHSVDDLDADLFDGNCEGFPLDDGGEAFAVGEE